MTNQHPTIPSPVLIKQWRDEWFENDRVEYSEYSYIATRAAQWGADCELEACCEWLKLEGHEHEHEALLAARRKAPSLKEQALETLQRLSKDGFPCNYQEDSDWDTIRRALEALPDG
jgi:hypothetical protein